ncbi:MAG: hypothetical protein LBU32_24185, partial [Clostridiales bacterium]|nr:hypothetical protein [Clostridiales bacterium]
ADERKSLRRELEVMDILLDESILDLADEALKARYETALKNKAKMGIDLRHGYLNCSYCLVNDYILVYRFSSNVSFFC